MQLMLCQAIMNDDIDLITALLTANPFAVKHIKRYIKEENRFSKSIFSANRTEIRRNVKRTKTRVGTQDDMDSSYRTMYRIYERFKHQK
jgi:hypothetical protein